MNSSQEPLGFAAKSVHDVVRNYFIASAVLVVGLSLISFVDPDPNSSYPYTNQLFFPFGWLLMLVSAILIALNTCDAFFRTMSFIAVNFKNSTVKAVAIVILLLSLTLPIFGFMILMAFYDELEIHPFNAM